jgi:phosphate/sulfate permease
LILISFSGAFIGLMLEGHKLNAPRILLLGEKGSPEMLTAILLISILMVAAFNIYKVPISLTQILLGSMLGAALSLGVDMPLNYVALLVGSWIFIPILSIVVSYVLVKGVSKLYFKAPVFTTLLYLKVLTLISSFYISYIFGANTIGFLASLAIEKSMIYNLLLVVITYLGLYLFGRYIESMIGEEIFTLGIEASFGSNTSTALLIEAMTQLGIPISISQSVTTGLIGTIFTKKVSLPDVDIVASILFQWILAPLSSLVLTVISLSIIQVFF